MPILPVLGTGYVGADPTSPTSGIRCHERFGASWLRIEPVVKLLSRIDSNDERRNGQLKELRKALQEAWSNLVVTPL